MITLDRLNRKEAIRYLGGAGISLNYRMDVLMDECEKEILKTAEPRFLYLERIGGIVHPQYIRVHIIGGGAVVRQRVDVVVEGIDGGDRHQSRIQNLLGSLLQVDGMLGSHAGIHRLIVVDGIMHRAVLRF